MNLDEALAVYIYLYHNSEIAAWQYGIYKEAWDVIYDEAEKVIERRAKETAAESVGTIPYGPAPE